MLGHMAARVLAPIYGAQLRLTARSAVQAQLLAQRHPQVAVSIFDAENASAADLQTLLTDVEWVINAVGIIKPYIHDTNAAEVERAIRVNALFPYALAQAAAQAGMRVLQIATDCVYSGATGGYAESAPHDPLDVYGKTKSLGEVHSAQVFHLRSSIIGPETKDHVSLLDWFRFQPQQSTVQGYTNHLWNGVTTLHFARICAAIIANPTLWSHTHHLVPSDQLSKAAMLQCFATAFERPDITIVPKAPPSAIDRTLTTEQPTLNQALWAAAGYAEIPSIAAMIAELAAFEGDSASR